MLKNLKKFLFILIIFISLSLFSCTFLFGYQIEGTKWSGTILFANMILEFQANGVVKTGSIELIYNTVYRNQGTYTFDKTSMAGTITLDGSIATFSINEQTNVLTLNSEGLSIPFTDVTESFSWPAVNAAGCRYIGYDYYYYDYYNYDTIEIEISFLTKTSGNITFTNIDTYSFSTYPFTATWDDETYSGKIYFSSSSNNYAIDYQISIDKKYCVFDYLSDDPIYCELQ
jgi:hypothetical protein